MNRKNCLSFAMAFFFLALFSFPFNSKAEWCENFKSGDIWYIESLGISTSTTPLFEFLYTRIKCCLQGTDMDACNNSLEADECSQYAVRPPCSPITNDF
jgi:hypothetical protein